MKMKIVGNQVRIVAVVWGAMLFFLAGKANAQQERPTVNPQTDTVYVSADGKFETAPDTAVIQFNIDAQQPTSAEAYTRASIAAERMRKVLRDNGIDPKMAELSFYSVQPVLDYRSPKHTIVGYHVSTSVTLKLKDFAKVGPLVDGLSNIEDTGNQSLSYTLEAMEAAKQKAIEDAFQKAKASASTVSRAGGRTLGELSYASVDTFEQIQPVRMMRQSAVAGAMQAQTAPTADFSPQKSTVTAHVNAIFMLK
jgi:uncharacterized protein YggE